MITVIYASESEMIKGALKRAIKEAFGDSNPENCVRLDMRKYPLYELTDELSTMYLGFDRKCVVAEDFFYLAKSKRKPKLEANEKPKELIDCFRHPDEAIDCFITVYSPTLEEKSEFIDALKEGGAKFLKVADMDEASWRKFIPAYFKKRGASISDEATSLLIERSGLSYSLMVREMDKLIAYANGDMLTAKDVDTLVGKPLEENAFLLVDALIKDDNPSKALGIYRDLMVRNQSPISLFNMIANQFLILDQVRHLKEKGMDKMAIASSLGVTPGRVGASFYNLRYTDKEEIRRALEEIYRLEGDVFAGKYDDKLALEMFIITFRSDRRYEARNRK